jgi:membrane-bound ClpP family serine protease
LLYRLEPIATAGLILIVFGVALLLACAFARVRGRQRSI